MAARKPTPESKRSRQVSALFDSIVSLPIDGPPAKKVTRKEIAKMRSKRWDGADDAAFDILELANSIGRYDPEQKRKLIAARLRKIAQGPRKWGVLR